MKAALLKAGEGTLIFFALKLYQISILLNKIKIGKGKC